MLAQLHPARLARIPQGGEHEARIDRVVVGRFERQAHGGSQRRLALAGLARAQALGAQAERFAEGDLALELARLVLVAGEQQRAGARQPHLGAGGRVQLRGEGRPHLRRAQPQLEQPAPGLAELHLGHRREHARGHARGSPADRVALEHRHRHPPLRARARPRTGR